MSESSGLTNRYAKALYELAAEKKIVSKILLFTKLSKVLVIDSPCFTTIYSSLAGSKLIKAWYGPKIDIVNIIIKLM